MFNGSWRTLKNKNIETFKSKLGVSHNMTITKADNGYLGVGRLDKDTSRTHFMKKIGDCRSLVEYEFDNNFNIKILKSHILAILTSVLVLFVAIRLGLKIFF